VTFARLFLRLFVRLCLLVWRLLSSHVYLPVCCFVCTAEAVVQFDYAAREPDELTLKKGDVITDVKPMPDGWMEGHKDGRKGMFPDTYVKVSCTALTDNHRL